MAYTTEHINRFLKLLNGEIVDVANLEINYISFGDGITPASASDTQLENERFRKPITAKARQVGLVSSIVALLEDEANDFDIHEIGIVANGTATANSGELISRLVFADKLPKISGSILNFARKDEVTQNGI
jgi:hypothetical protein